MVNLIFFPFPDLTLISPRPGKSGTETNSISIHSLPDKVKYVCALIPFRVYSLSILKNLLSVESPLNELGCDIREDGGRGTGDERFSRVSVLQTFERPYRERESKGKIFINFPFSLVHSAHVSLYEGCLFFFFPMFPCPLKEFF